LETRENEIYGDIEYGMQGKAQEVEVVTQGAQDEVIVPQGAQDEMMVTQGAQDEILRIQQEDQRGGYGNTS